MAFLLVFLYLHKNKLDKCIKLCYNIYIEEWRVKNMPRKPKCKICGLDVDKEGDNWFKNSVGYYHITCRQKKNLPTTEDEHLASKSIAPESVKEEFLKRDSGAKTIKCYFCGLAADSAKALRKDGKAFHNDCYPEYKDRTELFR